MVVVTAAERGAAYTGPDGHGMAPAELVHAVDTTGAGDAFLGAFALHLARGHRLPDAVTAAVQAGTVAVQYRGAQPQRTTELPGKHKA
jgi:ribokinase